MLRGCWVKDGLGLKVRRVENLWALGLAFGVYGSGLDGR